MKHLLHLFAAQEDGSFRSLPEGVPRNNQALAFYGALIAAVLDGDEALRAKGTWFGLWRPPPLVKRPVNLLIPAAALIDEIRAHDEQVADMLVRTEPDPLFADDARYLVVYPPGLTPRDVDALGHKLVSAAAACRPTLLPDDINAAWRRVFSQEAARFGIDFPAILD